MGLFSLLVWASHARNKRRGGTILSPRGVSLFSSRAVPLLVRIYPFVRHAR
jgi:hypothetical protein